MAFRSPRHYVYKGKELRDLYIQNIILAFVVSIGVVFILFLSIKKIEVGVYKPSQLPQPLVVSFVPVIREIEELPPPVKPKLEVKIVQTKEKKISPINTQETSKEEENISPVELKQAEVSPLENVPLPTLSQSEEIYEFFKVEVKPKIIKQVQPEYPELARKAGIEGKVVISAVVDENGDVVKAEILSSTNSIFNEPALKAAYKYKFSPAMMKDKKVKVKVLIPFNFTVQK